MLPVSDFKYIATKSNLNINKPLTSLGYLPEWQSLGKVKIKLLLTLGAVLFCLFGTQLVFASNLSTGGEKLVSIEKEIQDQETENLKLKTQIAQSSSLSTLFNKAQSWGFEKPQKVISN
ncbi:hypothetical protein HY024_01760 [Candidatus Curtissbacteria bacterium]|nr:hypothetical protein [Candidatus Curtissbacteria bacterium]